MSPKQRTSPCDKLADSQIFEMQKSSYLFTEATSLLLFIISCIISWQFAYHHYGIIVTIIVFVCIFHLIWFFLLIILVPKLKKPPHSNWFKPSHKVPQFIIKTIETTDGCILKYYLSEIINPNKVTNKKKIICLAPPLGQSGHLTYDPLITHLGTDDYIYITCDYRGFFGSNNINKYTQSPPTNTGNITQKLIKIRDISIYQFANDINEILIAENIDHIDHMIGHSLGVSVTLEFVVSFPSKIDNLILLNGSHGTVFSTAFQPVLRIPFIGDLVQHFVGFMLNNPYYMDYIRYYVLQPGIKLFFRIYTKIFGSPLLQKLMGDNYLFDFLTQYLNGICDCNKSLYHYIRVFQELHSHSVYHLLHKVPHPTLIVSGLWDLFTPCLVSFEMARELKNSRHCCDIYSSHMTILENPESCVYEIVEFIKSMQERKHKHV